MWLTEYTEQMHNLRTRIKRRKEAQRKTHLHESSSSSSKTSSVEADWQFVNFNPCMYGPRKSAESSDNTNISSSSSYPNIASSSSPNGSLQQGGNPPVVGSSSTEDFYEFPTSTNLKHVSSPSSTSSIASQPQVSNPGLLRDKEGLSSRDPSFSKYLRHSITSTFDLLPNQIQVQGQYGHNHQQQQPQHNGKSGNGRQASVVEDSKRSSRPLSGLGLVHSGSSDSVVKLSKSHSILSTSSSSSTTSVSTSGCSSNPVSRSSSRCTPVSQSKFYVPAPGSSRPPLPLPREVAAQSRPHSWDADSGTGTLVVNGRDVIYAKKSSNRYPVVTSHSSAASVSDKRKRYLHNEQPLNRKVQSHSKPKFVSPRIPHPPPMPSFSLDESLLGFPPSRGSIPFPANFSVVGSLCLSVISNTRGDRPLTGSGSSASNLKGDRRPDTLNEERLENDGQVCEDEDMNRVRQEPKRSSNAVARSESCKEPPRKQQPRERRKHSDPNLTSKSSDVDLDNRHLSDANNSGSSSNSSLSARSVDSPNTSSLELVAQSHSSSSLRGLRGDSETPDHSTVRHSEVITDSYKSSLGWDRDSDIEIEQDAPVWTKDVPEETLGRLDRLEKKRQEVLNELFHTERLFVRKLKIMDRLFFRPMKSQQSLSSDLIHVLFPNLEEVLEMHEQFNNDLKKKRSESPVIGDIGPVLLEMFDGERGENLKRAASTFCARQQLGLELLREKRKREVKFNTFLTEAESDPVCRRLGIKDMIPTVMQRLTKYPLLFENLCNCTAADSTEYKNLQRALELSKEILCSVNLAKKEAEDEDRLQDIQRRLDKSFFDKGVERSDHSFNDLRNFDFTRHKLMYDGSLMWRLNKPRGDRKEHQEVLLVLLEDMIVLLLKVDDRYVLKMHNVGTGKSERFNARPIIKLNTLHATRAADNKGFYLISKTSPSPFMFELVCTTAEERLLWLQHITKAADDYKSRQESRRSEVHPISNIPPSASESEDRSNESGEVTETNSQETSDPTSDSGTQQEPTQMQKDASPAPDHLASKGAESPSHSPEKGVSGEGSLSVGAKEGQSVSASPSPSPARRKQEEFLRVTESSHLIDPSEVVVETTEVHFAKIVVSPHEELKRADSKIHIAFDEKLKLISKMCHIPPEATDMPESSDASDSCKPKDAKELVVACISQVDQLGRLIATQSITSENIQLQKEQLSIHKVLNGLLTQLLSEVHRKDEDLELRRQELHRIREQNHGYQERLQAKAAKVSDASLVSPARSPTHSRPNSVSLSSSSDHHDCTHEDETEVVAKAPLKQQLSAPVASSSSNSTSPLPVNLGETGCAFENAADTHQGESSRTPSTCQKGHHSQLASELAQEEFADARDDLVTTDWESAIETNRESTETEVIAPTNEICQQQGVSGQQESGEISQMSSGASNTVPENGKADTECLATTVVSVTSTSANHHNESMTNGHPFREVDSAPGESTEGENNNTEESITNGKNSSTKETPPPSANVQEGAQENTVES